MNLSPSKKPEKESKQFGVAALICGVVSLLLWFVGIAALGLGGRPDFTVYNRSGQIKRVYEIKSGNARLSPAQKSNQIKLKSNFKLVRWF